MVGGREGWVDKSQLSKPSPPLPRSSVSPHVAISHHLFPGRPDSTSPSPVYPRPTQNCPHQDFIIQLHHVAEPPCGAPSSCPQYLPPLRLPLMYSNVCSSILPEDPTHSYRNIRLSATCPNNPIQILVLFYHRCPVNCSLQIHGLQTGASLSRPRWRSGVSIFDHCVCHLRFDPEQGRYVL